MHHLDDLAEKQEAKSSLVERIEKPRNSDFDCSNLPPNQRTFVMPARYVKISTERTHHQTSKSKQHKKDCLDVYVNAKTPENKNTTQWQISPGNKDTLERLKSSIKS